MWSIGEQDPEIKAVLDTLEADADEALKKAEELLRAAQAKGDKAAVARTKRALSCIYFQKGEAMKAQEAAKDSVATFKELKDTAGQCLALRCSVEVQVYLGDVAAATKLVTGALSEFRTASDAKGEAYMVLLQAELMSASEDYDGAAAQAAGVKDVYNKMDSKSKDQSVGYCLLKLSEFYMQCWKPEEAVQAAEDAVAIFRGLSGKEAKPGEAAALHVLAQALVTDQKCEAAVTKVNDALVIFSSLGDKVAQTAAMRTKINAYIADKKSDEARNVAVEAAGVFRKAGDVKGEATAQLLVAEVCVQTNQKTEAVAAATEALKLFKTADSKAGQAAALSAISTADFDNELGQGISAAKERVELFKEMQDGAQQADALMALANIHVARMGRKIARCSIASQEDSIAALRAAKDAHGLFGYTGNPGGMETAMRAVAQVLLYNGVPSDVIEVVRDPEEVFQDVMNGKYSDKKNALPQSAVVPSNKKIEEIVPSAKQLERGKFGWSDPLKGYSYTLIWQPAKDRTARNKRPRGSYDVVGLTSGSKISAAPALFQTRSNDACERDDPLVVYMVSNDVKENYCSAVMSAVNVCGAMITAKMTRITFVSFDEAHFDWTDTKVRQPNFHPAILGMLRSLRLEAPNMTVGFVGGDAPSWIADPAPMIESIFDVLESDESEVIYKRGDAFAPLLVHRPLDEATQFVKPKKKQHGWRA
mmetsp:Transcript_82988/g.209196  ORF Transcript_82988/g.209196 Transcript_82988/m.209196 type:complete len:705 (+) Transcript_82988:121-2235(+)